MDISTYRSAGQEAVERTRESLGTIRTGRASAALIENTPITTYGGQATLRLMELATIMSDGPQDLLVNPFDPSVTQDIENTLRNAQLGFIVSVQGTTIRVKNPPLSQEQREKYAKLVSQYAEEGREKLRKARDEIRKDVKAAFDAGEISEDEKYRTEQEIETATKAFMDRIEEVKQAKQREVMTV